MVREQHVHESVGPGDVEADGVEVCGEEVFGAGVEVVEGEVRGRFAEGD